MMSDWRIIPFGKYKYKNFNQIKDISYLKWYIGQLNNDRQIRCCAYTLIRAIDEKYKGKVEEE